MQKLDTTASSLTGYNVLSPVKNGPCFTANLDGSFKWIFGGEKWVLKSTLKLKR